MVAETHANDHELARLRTMRAVAVVFAMVAFGTLVVGFGLQWKPWFQVPAGLAAWAGIEWQRRCGQKIKALTKAA